MLLTVGLELRALIPPQWLDLGVPVNFDDLGLVSGADDAAR